MRSSKKDRKTLGKIGPKVSIVTPSYNQVRFLEQTLLSVLNQDYPNLEYIVIDGGSTDGSLDVIKKYQDRIDYWVSEPDAGQSHAINKGLREATGDVVAWLNSDDLYFPDAVSRAAKEFQQNKNLALFYGNCVFIDENGRFIRYFTEVEDWNEVRLRNYSDFIMQPTTFFSREKLHQAGFLDERLDYGMDWDLWCRLAQTGDVYYGNGMIAANRDYKDTKTNNGSWKRLQELLTINLRHMTGIWPHAFFGFCGTELRQKAESAEFLYERFLYRFLRLVSMGMSPSAIWYGKRTRHKRNLYGIRHHSGIVEDGAATVYLPVKNQAEAIEIAVSSRRQGIVEIQYDGLTKSFPVNGSPVEKILPLSNQDTDHGSLELRLTFKSEDGTPIPGEIISVGFVDGGDIGSQRNRALRKTSARG
jgi:glycosyltransferase involved in cell wall biosynthesis